MAQQINDSFQVLAGLPIDDRIVKPSITERDNISSTRRFQGLKCFVVQTQTEYTLLGGITNANWIGTSGANSSNALESIIDGFYVLLAGKETPLDFEVGDKFRGWIENRYLVGIILSLPVSLPSDIDNPARVELAIDSNASTGISEQIEFTATGGETSHDIGTDSIVKSWFWDGSPQAKSQWSQTGSILTFAFPLSAGSFNIFI